jgi:hypothetical protein
MMDVYQQQQATVLRRAVMFWTGCAGQTRLNITANKGFFIHQNLIAMAVDPFQTQRSVL